MSHQDQVRELLEQYGTTYADEAGITLRDKPAPLYQLLVLTVLFSVRIRADIAVAAARELFKAGWRTPKALLGSTWQQRVDALGRGGYQRYDESTATYLADDAQLLLDRYRGDLRGLRDEAGGDPDVIRERLTEFPRIGPVGAEIFCREAQAVWPGLRPSFDRRALTAARDAGLPADAESLAGLVPAKDLRRLAAALVRRSLSG
ncbi:MAG TPA: endonuclease [Pseudonocardiaceae bacterium]|nr:endonuclease [Pseudonocardiaceae bacterium]